MTRRQDVTYSPLREEPAPHRLEGIRNFARSAGRSTCEVTADVSFICADGDGNMFGDVYAGYEPTGTGDGALLRLQRQLVL